jgi:ABC-type multidrug transport system fused ATPase/permease subunit
MDEFSIYEVPLNRKKNYYKSLLTQSFAAKDLRLYNLTGRYKEIYNGLWSGIRKERTKIFEENTISSFLASLFSYAGIVSIIIFSVHLVMNGTMSIGTFALYIGLSQAIGEKFKYIFVCIMCQKEITAPRIIRLINFLNYENKIKDNGKKEITNLSAIEFKNVFFKYPNCQNYVLKGFNLRIAKGKKIALIGINGAGKSTIVKLLLRFYEPESGQIMINGEDIHQYSLDELHKIFAVCFQDINTYSLTFKENIALSDIDRIDNIENIKKAARASGADKILNNLPLGLDTDMTRNFNNEGVELSGGQWQKVALARAFFKKSDFIILDEPTASLDPEAEDYLFRSFKWLCRDKGGHLDFP